LAVIGVLADDGRIGDDEFDRVLLDLARSYFVDLPLGRGAIVGLAAETQFAVGPATAAIARPTAWVDVQDAFVSYGEILAAAETIDRRLVWEWLSAAAVGFALRVGTGSEVTGAGMLTAITVYNTSASPDETRAALASVRRSLERAAVEGDPLEPMVAHLTRRHLADGPGGMLRLRRQLSGLSVEDQFAVRRFT
jgi:hypothetical protein